MTSLKTMFENYAQGGTTNENTVYNSNRASDNTKRSELNYIVDIDN